MFVGRRQAFQGACTSLWSCIVSSGSPFQAPKVRGGCRSYNCGRKSRKVTGSCDLEMQTYLGKLAHAFGVFAVLEPGRPEAQVATELLRGALVDEMNPLCH